jgi:predicted metal-binding membrane protein
MSVAATDRRLAGVAAVCFVGAATATAAWCSSMSAMGMPMPGGWTMSMAWMRMPGQTWPGAAAAFLGMWVVMMVAMMLPPLMPMLVRYRRAVRAAAGSRLGGLTAMAAGGYFVVWTLAGVVVYPSGMAIAAIGMGHEGLARWVPTASAVVVLLAGVVQCTAWKRRRLACCRAVPLVAAVAASAASAATPAAAVRHGLFLGLECARCCANLMLIAVVMGVMDLTVMALVTAVIAAERLAPAGALVAHSIGVGLIVGGALMLM